MRNEAEYATPQVYIVMHVHAHTQHQSDVVVGSEVTSYGIGMFGDVILYISTIREA